MVLLYHGSREVFTRNVDCESNVIFIDDFGENCAMTMNIKGTNGRLNVKNNGGGGSFRSKTAAAQLSIMYSLGAGGIAGSGAAVGSTGGTTTVTFQGDTLYAYGGSGGAYNTYVTNAGGTASGGDTNVTGGTGRSYGGEGGAGAGGAIGGGNDQDKPGGNIYSSEGSVGGSSVDVSGLFSVLSSLSIATTSPGSGGNSNSPFDGPQATGQPATGFGCGGGGAGWYGGPGGDGLYGGGGGGAAGGQIVHSGGTGGIGVVIAQFTGGTPAQIILTSGTSYAVPAGTTQVKIWAIGAGGGGSGVTGPADATRGGGGGGGGVAVKTWTL